MPAIGSNEVFLLIKSLEKAEKAYFTTETLSFSKGRTPLHLKLFLFLCKQKEYNERKALDYLKPVKKGHYSRIKKRLYERILKSLNNYNSGLNNDTRIQELIRSAVVLFEKKFIESANKFLLKAKELANKCERYEYLPVISFLENDIILYQSFGKIESFLAVEPEKQGLSLERIKNINEYKKLYIEAKAELMRQSAGKSEIDHEKFFNHPLLSSPENAITTYSLNLYYAIHHMMYSMNLKYDIDTVKMIQRELEYLERDTDKLFSNRYNYLRFLSRLMIYKFNNSDELDVLFNKSLSLLKLFPYRLNEYDMDYFTNIIVNYMAGQLKMIYPEKALKGWKEFNLYGYNPFSPLKKGKVRAYEDRQIDNSFVVMSATRESGNIVLLGNLFTIYFLLEQYDRALDFVNKIIRSKVKTRFDVQHDARIFELFIHYELGNHELLPYKARAFERFLIKHKIKMSKYYKNILSCFINILPGVSSRKEEVEIFKVWKGELLQLPKEPVPTEYDIMDWIESKIQSRTFVDILRLK